MSKKKKKLLSSVFSPKFINLYQEELLSQVRKFKFPNIHRLPHKFQAWVCSATQRHLTDLYGTYSCRVVKKQQRERDTCSLCWIAYKVRLNCYSLVANPFTQLSVSLDGGGRNVGEWYTYNDNILGKRNVFGIIHIQNKHFTMYSVAFTYW